MRRMHWRGLVLVLGAASVLAGLQAAPTGASGPHAHNHIMPRPGESRLTLLPENFRLEKRWLKRHRPAYCTGPASMFHTVTRIACSGLPREGDSCLVPGQVRLCVSGGCKQGTCYCGSSGKWIFLG